MSMHRNRSKLEARQRLPISDPTARNCGRDMEEFTNIKNAAFQRLLKPDAKPNDYARLAASFPMLEPLLLELLRARLDAKVNRQLLEQAQRLLSQSDRDKVSLERDRQQVKGSGKTTARILAAEFGMSKQAVSERLRRLKRDGVIRTSIASDLTPDEVNIVRATLLLKASVARGKPKPKK